MENIIIGDYVQITDWGYGTYKENVGCISEVKNLWKGGVMVNQDGFLTTDDSEYHWVSYKAVKKVKPPKKVVNTDKLYEIY